MPHLSFFLLMFFIFLSNLKKKYIYFFIKRKMSKSRGPRPPAVNNLFTSHLQFFFGVQGYILFIILLKKVYFTYGGAV